MIFSGDFVFPKSFSSKIFEGLGKEFLKRPKIVNFESTFNEFNTKQKTKGIALHSKLDAIEALKHLNVKCTSHANNHITDFEFNYEHYTNAFHKEKIESIGFGRNINEASKPFIYKEEKLIILAFGWETIRCKAAKKNSLGVNPYRYNWVETQVLKFQNTYPAYRIVLFIHWNYEFETYPLPADRQFVQHMIDIGVDGIFGHHPHVINGYEIYKGKPIFYSLGNFYFPQVKFGNHQLNFRDTALEGISVDFNGNLNDLRIYHHSHDKQGECLKLNGCYKLGEFEKLNQLSEFRELDHKSYISFYKKNRFHKKKFLPVYKNYKNNIQNSVFDAFVKFRQIPIDTLTKLKNVAQ